MFKVAYFSMEFALHEEFPVVLGRPRRPRRRLPEGRPRPRAARRRRRAPVGRGLHDPAPRRGGRARGRVARAPSRLPRRHRRPRHGPRRRSRRRVPRVARGPIRDRAALPPRADRAPGPVDHAAALRSPARLPDRPGDAPRHRRGARAAAPPPRRQHVPLQRGPCGLRRPRADRRRDGGRGELRGRLARGAGPRRLHHAHPGPGGQRDALPRRPPAASARAASWSRPSCASSAATRST